MPTWGTVLSPGQIDDLVALLTAWREGQAVKPAISTSKHLTSALFALQQFDPLDAEFRLNAALDQANNSQTKDIQAILALIQQKDRAGAEAGLIALLPPEEIGKELFAAYCAPCHGVDGSGGIGKNLNANSFIQANTDNDLVAFLLAGREGTAMDGFQGLMTTEQLSNIVTLLRTWQK